MSWRLTLPWFLPAPRIRFHVTSTVHDRYDRINRTEQDSFTPRRLCSRPLRPATSAGPLVCSITAGAKSLSQCAYNRESLSFSDPLLLVSPSRRIHSPSISSRSLPSSPSPIRSRSLLHCCPIASSSFPPSLVFLAHGGSRSVPLTSYSQPEIPERDHVGPSTGPLRRWLRPSATWQYRLVLSG